MIARVTWATMLLLAGCESWDPAIMARRRAVETFSCDTVEMTQTGENRWHAIGCGHEGDFACTGGTLEPTCLQFRTAGGEAPEEDERDAAHATPTVAESEAALYAQAEREDPDLDPTTDEAAAETRTDASGASAAETMIRAGLDAHRADIYACTQHDPTVLRVTYEPDGTLEVHLAGGMEGTPEEGCVRAALSGAHAPEGEQGTVLHLVHGS